MYILFNSTRTAERLRKQNDMTGKDGKKYQTKKQEEENNVMKTHT